MTGNNTSDEKSYDNETHERAVRVIGGIEAISEAAKNLRAMPCDGATQRLLGAIQFLTQQATLSAWEYARQYAPPKDET